jgi:outer membrane immunogenic protein
VFFLSLGANAMKKLFLASVFGFAFVGSAIAADMRMPAKAAPPIARPACAQFGGWYVGANVGWGYLAHNYHDRDNLAQFTDDDLPTSTRDTKSGVNGGVQAGYNYQTGCTLFGIEADWSWSDTNASSFNTDGDGPVGAPGTDTLSVSSKMRWFGTVRARSGVIVDNVLLYVTGGLAYANFNNSVSIFEDDPATTLTLSRSKTRWGWTAGLGTEWAFAPNWSLKSEVLYMRFEKDTATFIGDGLPAGGNLGQAYRLESQNEAWISRIGVNYRFGGPVVARY